MPLDGIAPGEYAMKMSLGSLTPMGKSCLYDTIVDVGHFVVTDDPAKTTASAGRSGCGAISGSGRWKSKGKNSAAARCERWFLCNRQGRWPRCTT